jgi:hypothetical protein
MPECEENPEHCKMLLAHLRSLKRLLRQTWDSHPFANMQPLRAANTLALALENVLLQLIPFDEQVVYAPRA